MVTRAFARSGAGRGGTWLTSEEGPGSRRGTTPRESGYPVQSRCAPAALGYPHGNNFVVNREPAAPAQDRQAAWKGCEGPPTATFEYLYSASATSRAMGSCWARESRPSDRECRRHAVTRAHADRQNK